MDTVVCSIDAERRLRVGVIGCGRHAFLNVLPALQFAPMDLVAVCDGTRRDADEIGRRFGSQRAYADIRALLDHEQDLDAVIITADAAHNVGASTFALAASALAAGCHVWQETVPSGTLDGLDAVRAAVAESGRFLQVNGTGASTPAIARVGEISRREEFGGIVSVYLSASLGVPSAVGDADERSLRDVIGDLWRPLGVLHYLAGDADYLTVRRTPNGGAAALLKFRSGAVGALNLTGGTPGRTEPVALDWLEVVGAGQSLVLDNAVRLTWYGKPTPPPGGYQRATTFIGGDDGAARRWEPALGQPRAFNANHVLAGSTLDLNHFAHAVLSGQPPTIGTIDQCEEISAWLEAFRASDGERISVSEIRRRAGEAAR